MPNHQLDAEAGFSPSLSRQAAEHQVEEPGERSALSLQSDPLAQVTCRAGDSSCAGAHADALNRATDSQPARSGQSLVQLQRQYGNRFVQRVLAVSRKADGATEAAPEVEQAVQAARGGGQALDGGVRAQMESAFDADFSGVRVHADSQSDTLNRSLNARAFTTGQDVFFRQGAYNPSSSGGRELLAHELTHVVQQTGDEVRRKLTINAPGDRYEQEADQVALAIVQQESVQEDADERLVSRQVEEEEEEEEPIQAKMEDAWVQLQEEEEEEEEETIQAKMEDAWVQRQEEEPEEEEEEPIQTKAEGSWVQRKPVTVYEFPPETIAVSAREKARILKKAGWKQRNVIVVLKDFRGQPLSGHRVYGEFKAPGVEAVNEGGEAKGGVVIWPKVWLKPTGTVRLIAVSIGKADLAPQGVTFYKLSTKGLMKFEAVQSSREITVTATTSKEAATKAGAKGTAGVDFKVFSIGGEVSTEAERRRGRSLAKTWKVIVPTATFTVKQIS